ncbi:MAG: glycosyltransferase [Nanoarchaeota archaeon]|nr:glycosyltransferase [Nanoarchaeota archaeon]
MIYSDSTVIIPTLNEEKNIGRLIDFLKNNYSGIRIIVADDGSSDKTIKIAEEKKVFVLNRENKPIKGISAAVVDALKFVKTKSIIVMDADFQHPPEKVKEMIEKLENYDLVIGSRSSVPKNWGFLRKLQSKIANLLCNLRLGRKIKDSGSGFFGIKTNLFKKINKKNFELRCFKILFNILKNTKNIKIGCVYYDFNLRQGGQSKISKKHVYYFLKNLIK